MTNPAPENTRSCPACGIAVPPEALFCPSDGTPIPAPDDRLLLDRTIGGRFHVTRKLGQGGMGQVYLATQLGTNRPCALKVLKPQVGWDPSVVARFHREAANASRINHPNVAQVYDSGEADGVMFIAMEFVDGETLAAVLEREGRLSPRRTARIVWQSANALSAAHEMGTVHRDLKPANIMLTSYRQWSDFVKIVDFGIAKGMAARESEQVTSASVVVGTPEYMAPEQFLSADPNPRSDVYSLALTAVRCLAGRLPPAVGLAVLPHTDPGNPAGLLDLPGVDAWPADVTATLRRALAWKPDARQPSVEAFAAEFARAASAWEPAEPGTREPWDGRIEAAGPPPADAAPTQLSAAADGGGAARPRRALAIAGGVAALAVVGIVAIALLPTRRDGGNPAPAPAPPPAIAPPAGPAPDTAAAASRDTAAPRDTIVRRDPAPAVFIVADSLRQLERLTDPMRMDGPSARRAVDLYRRTRPRLDTRDARVAGRFYAARAMIQLRDEAAACATLREAATESEGTAFAEAVRTMLDAGCR